MSPIVDRPPDIILVCTEHLSNKFYKITKLAPRSPIPSSPLEHFPLRTEWGRIKEVGNPYAGGQSKEILYSSGVGREHAFNQLVNQKIRKGYRAVLTSSNLPIALHTPTVSQAPTVTEPFTAPVEPEKVIKEKVKKEKKPKRKPTVLGESSRTNQFVKNLLRIIE